MSRPGLIWDYCGNILKDEQFQDQIIEYVLNFPKINREAKISE